MTMTGHAHATTVTSLTPPIFGFRHDAQVAPLVAQVAPFVGVLVVDVFAISLAN